MCMIFVPCDYGTNGPRTVALGHDDVPTIESFSYSDLLIISCETKKVVLISSANVAQTMISSQYSAGMNTYPGGKPP